MPHSDDKTRTVLERLRDKARAAVLHRREAQRAAAQAGDETARQQREREAVGMGVGSIEPLNGDRGLGMLIDGVFALLARDPFERGRAHARLARRLADMPEEECMRIEQLVDEDDN